MVTQMMTKIERVYTELRDRITLMPAGTRFPSIREVMREFNVSQITVDKAMEMLSQEGLITKQPKRGIFTAYRDTSNGHVKRHTLAVAVPSYPSSVYERYLQELCIQAKRIGEVAEVIRYDWRDRIIQALPKKGIDALILVPTSARLTPADFYGLSQYKVPIVLISRMIRDVAVDCVEPDNTEGGALAAEHLVSLGHRKLAILLAEPMGVSAESRMDGFTRKTAMMGIDEVLLIDSETKPGENSALKAYETLKAKIKEHGLIFSGLFVLSDATALGALRALHDLKISIPGQVSVVGFGDDPEAVLYHPSLTTIRGDYAEVARMAVEIVERRLAGEKDEAIQKTVPMTLVARESTGRSEAGRQ